MSDLTKITICYDCLAVLANGETWDEFGNDITEDVVAMMEDMWEATRILLGGEDEGFSWSPCEGCGTRLGGDRFAAYVEA